MSEFLYYTIVSGSILSFPIFFALKQSFEILRAGCFVLYITPVFKKMNVKKINIAVLYYITVAAVSCKQHGTGGYTVH